MTHQHDDKLGNVKQTYGKQAFIWKLGKMMRRYIHIYIYIYIYTYIKIHIYLNVILTWLML